VFDFLKVSSAPLMGMDISSSAIKVVELSRTKGKYVVEAFGIEMVAPQSIVERNIKEIDKVAESIHRLVKRVNVSSKCVAVAVTGSSVLTRIIQLSRSYAEVQVAEQIEVDAERYFPYPLEQMYYDFQIVGPFAKNPELADVLLAAARVDTVDTRVTAIVEAGLKPTVVDIESLAVERAFALVVNHLPEKGKGCNFALIDIGGSITTVYIFRELHIIYNREQAFGGKHLTDEIQRRYGLTPEESNIAQKHGGLPEDYITEVLNPFKETVVQQISRSLQVFLSTSEETTIDYIVLAGGVAKLPGLDTLIQSKLKIKTFLANPFLEADVSSHVNKGALFDEAPGLMVACGLALRNFDNDKN